MDSFEIEMQKLEFKTYSEYIINNNCTVKDCAGNFSVSAEYVAEVLESQKNSPLYSRVCGVLERKSVVSDNKNPADSTEPDGENPLPIPLPIRAFTAVTPHIGKL